MRFTLWMIGAPLALFAVGVLVTAAVGPEVGVVVGAPAALWLFADLYVVPLYWAVRIVRYAWLDRAPH